MLKIFNLMGMALILLFEMQKRNWVALKNLARIGLILKEKLQRRIRSAQISEMNTQTRRTKRVALIGVATVLLTRNQSIVIAIGNCRIFMAFLTVLPN